MQDFTGKAPDYQCWSEMDFVYAARRMHWMARLLYRAALQAAWYESSRPDLPADDAELAQILGVPLKTWDIHKAAVKAMFQIDPDTGNLFQKRLRGDWRKISLYRERQAEHGKKRWKSHQTTDTTEDIANPQGSLNQPLTSKGKQSKVYIENHIDDDVIPAAALRDATLPGVGGTATANPAPSAPKTDDCAELTAYVVTQTGFQPPTQKSARELLQRYDIQIVKNAFDSAVEGKSKKDILGTVKLFFQGGAPGFILANQQKHFLESLKEGSGEKGLELFSDDEWRELVQNPPAGVSLNAVWDAVSRRNKLIDQSETEKSHA